MAVAHLFKIYTGDDELVGSLKYARDAAILVGFQGAGATVRLGPRKWQTIHTVEEGDDPLPGMIDVLAEHILERMAEVMVEETRRQEEKIGRQIRLTGSKVNR